MVNRDRKFTRTVEDPGWFGFIRYTPSSLGTTFIRKHILREGDRAKDESKGRRRRAISPYLQVRGKIRSNDEDVIVDLDIDGGHGRLWEVNTSNRPTGAGRLKL